MSRVDEVWYHTCNGIDSAMRGYPECKRCGAKNPFFHKDTLRDRQEGGSHYKDAKVQPWDVVDTWPREQQIGFYRGNVLKYVMRMGSKDISIQELRKAMHYMEKLEEVLKNEL